MESMASLLSVKRPWYVLNGEEQMDHQEWTLQCEDLSKEYQSAQAPCWAVREAHLTLHKGEFLMVMGKSGAGKIFLILVKKTDSETEKCPLSFAGADGGPVGTRFIRCCGRVGFATSGERTGAHANSLSVFSDRDPGDSCRDPSGRNAG